MFTLLNLRRIFGRIASDERGATAVEYGLIAFLIAVTIVGSVTDVGTQLKTVFGSVVTSLTAAAP